METLFAQVILRILQLKFDSSVGFNPNVISFENNKNQSIFISNMGNNIQISAYKIRNNCFSKSITDISELEGVIDQLKTKVHCNDIKNK